MISSDTMYDAEVAHRCRSMRQGLNDFKHFYTMTKDKTVAVSASAVCLFTKLLHNAPTWSELPDAQIRKLHGGYLTVLKRAVGVTYDETGPSMTDPQVLDRARVPAVTDILRLARLTYLPRLLTVAPPHTLVMIEAAGSWTKQL